MNREQRRHIIDELTKLNEHLFRSINVKLEDKSFHEKGMILHGLCKRLMDDLACTFIPDSQALVTEASIIFLQVMLIELYSNENVQTTLNTG